MPFYEFGDLFSYLKGKSVASNHFTYSKFMVVRVIRQLCSGITNMHQNEIIHCDIKPANILLKQAMEETLLDIAIADFGISRVLSGNPVNAFELSDLNGASIAYASPDMIYRLRKRKENSDAPVNWKAADVYSISIVVCEMIKRQIAWV